MGVLLAGVSASARAQGFEMFDTTSFYARTVTGEKPQSKLWFHDGSWWAILRGADGVAFYEKVGDGWVRAIFLDAILASSGNADVRWNGDRLLVLVYSKHPKYFEFTYEATLRVWDLVPGFPVSLPKPSGSETMVLDQDSTGRVWVAVEAGGSIRVYYTTSSDHQSWSSTPVILRDGVASDDICSLVAFGGKSIGVFWSDQNRDEYGFDIHRDNDPPDVWQPQEVVDAGAGTADDHINLAVDGAGRVYAITKDDFDRSTVHRRDGKGKWTHRRDVTGDIGTRGILMVSEDDLAYVLWTDWTKSPDRIECRTANLTDLQFGAPFSLIGSASGSMNNVTGTKQILPGGTLLAVAESAKKVWWNGWGPPAAGDLPPPSAPTDLAATLDDSLQRVELAWQPPASGAPDGYLVYRQVDGGTFERLTAGLTTSTTFTDSLLVAGELGYQVTAFANHQEGPASNRASVLYAPPPPPPPGSPLAVTATWAEASPAVGEAAYTFDEGAGQVVGDATGRGHEGQLGATPEADTSDPTWTQGVTGSALRFGGSNDRVVVADSDDLDFDGSFTIEAWVRLSKLGTADCVLAKGDSNRRNFWMEIDSSDRLDFRWETPGGADHGARTPGAAITDLEWHHLACVYDQEVGADRIYVDGALVHQAADAGTPVTNSDPLYVGAKTTAGSIKSAVNGDVDLVRLTRGVRYACDFVPPTAFEAGSPHAVVRLAWSPPATGSVDAFRIDRQGEDGMFTPAGTTPGDVLAWTDLAPPTSGACYRIVALDSLGQASDPCDPVCAAPAASKSASPAAAQPAARGLQLAVAPNPFNPITMVRFRLSESSRVNCAVYDVRGRRLLTLIDEARPAGEHTVEWHPGKDVPSGIYLLVLRAGAERENRKLVLTK